MPYIGKGVATGNFVKLDAITASATATYALTNGGVAFTPESVNQMIVSLNGVIQNPGTSFSLSGSNIVFSSTLSGSDSIDFILVFGSVLDVGVPTDNTVSLAKLTAINPQRPVAALNSKEFQTVLYPASGGWCSAKGMASLYSKISNGEIVEKNIFHFEKRNVEIINVAVVQTHR